MGTLSSHIIEAAAGIFGKLIAQGIVTPGEAYSALMEKEVRAGYAGDRSGLRCRCAWAVNDSAAMWEQARSAADVLIRKRLCSLFARRAPSAALISAAHAENAARGMPLLHHEVVAIVDEEAGWWIRKLDGRKRRAA